MPCTSSRRSSSTSIRDRTLAVRPEGSSTVATTAPRSSCALGASKNTSVPSSVQWRPSLVLGGPGTFRTKSEAKAARERARERLGEKRGDRSVTVAAFRECWITDPLFARPKESTMLHNAERTKAFADRYGELPIDRVGDEVVAEWLAGGHRNSTVSALRAMFNDAASAKAGRLVPVNPFAGLGIAKTKGNKHRQPPDEEAMWRMLAKARELTPPSFADYLEVACFTGMRPGELDALQWPQIRWDDDEIDVTVQWNVKTKTFTEPKYGPYTAALVAHARATLELVKRDSDSAFVFATIRGTHYTPSSRVYHWNRVRIAAGVADTTLYLDPSLLRLESAQRAEPRPGRDRRAAWAQGRRAARRGAVWASGQEAAARAPSCCV